MEEERKLAEEREGDAGQKSPRKAGGFLARHGRMLSFLAFIAGFVWDGLTLTYVSLNEAILILGIYLAIIALGIIAYNTAYPRRELPGFFARFLNLIPLIIQFMFGTLFNAFFIFYFLNAPIYGSWPFLLFLLTAVFGNEILRRRKDRLTFQMAMFFIAEFIFFVFAIPVLLQKIGPAVFVGSGILALLVLALEAFLLNSFARERFKEGRLARGFIVALIFIGVNIAYFENIIPPIPLALKSAGIYHSVSRVSEGYEVKYEPAPAKFFWRTEDSVYRIATSESAYAWSAVFAPSSLSLPIFHQWFYFDESKKVWEPSIKVEFLITGGREEGYRIYSVKENIFPGRWRVDVTTENGSILGRIPFIVVQSDKLVNLKTGIR